MKAGGKLLATAVVATGLVVPAAANAAPIAKVTDDGTNPVPLTAGTPLGLRNMDVKVFGNTAATGDGLGFTIAVTGPDGAPAATYVSAIVTQQQITVCWLGDSRAYWLPANAPAPAGPNDTIDITGGSRRVTRDDSLAEEIVAAGLATMDEAMASPQAHVITRWLGADLPEPEPHVEHFTPTGPGVLLLCSDGLWNYRPEAAELAAMAMPAALTRPLDAAADLAKFALDSGGLDNITVVIIPFPPRQDALPAAPATVPTAAPAG